jgi:DNA-directed RNA polymerase sigma subunit (sigma70/sigma32)
MGHDTRGGLSRAEIAKILGCTEEAVRQAELRGLKKLRYYAKMRNNPVVETARRHLQDCST